jgi:hypothetical protein
MFIRHNVKAAGKTKKIECKVPRFSQHGSTLATSSSNTLIKKETKFSSYTRKLKWDRVQSHIYEEGLPDV